MKSRGNTKKVVRTYQVGLAFPGGTVAEQKQEKQQVNTIIRDLQYQLYDKLTPDRITHAIQFLRTHPELQGTHGTAKLRKELQDCSNLGEAAYLPLLQAIKRMFVHEERVQTLLTILSTQSNACFEWLLLGRSPYIERCLQAKLGCSLSHARNLSNETRQKLEQYLPAEYQLKAPFPHFQKQQLDQKFEDFLSEIESTFRQREQQGKLHLKEKIFLQRVRQLHQIKDLVLHFLLKGIQDWNTNQPGIPTTRWKLAKQLSRTIAQLFPATTSSQRQPYLYHSVIRSLLTSAYLSSYPDSAAILHRIVQANSPSVNDLVTQPFTSSRRKKLPRAKKKLPLQLLMKSEYVVLRPGNGKKLTELAVKDGSFPILIYPPRKKKLGVTVQVIIHPVIQQFLAQGAEITTLVLDAGDQPANKLRAFLRMKGQPTTFYTRKRVEQLQTAWSSQLIPSSGVIALGVDVNRVSEHILAFSEKFQFQSDTKRMVQRYQQLRTVLSQLQLGLSRKRQQYYFHPTVANQKAWIKVQGELERVYRRRKRLLKQIHQHCGQYLTAMLLYHNCKILCYENLQLSANGTRGALARAILNMPDEEDLFLRSVQHAEWICKQPFHAIAINPYKLSTSTHYQCSATPKGILSRSLRNWDYARCSACSQRVNLHSNSAYYIRDLGLQNASSSVSGKLCRVFTNHRALTV